ncbi:MAG: hypothetical protein ACFB02_01530 [Mastigocoleus sp.]
MSQHPSTQPSQNYRVRVAWGAGGEETFYFHGKPRKVCLGNY